MPVSKNDKYQVCRAAYAANNLHDRIFYTISVFLWMCSKLLNVNSSILLSYTKVWEKGGSCACHASGERVQPANPIQVLSLKIGNNKVAFRGSLIDWKANGGPVVFPNRDAEPQKSTN